MRSAPGSEYRGEERRIGRIDRPPRRQAHASLPAEFGRRFLVFVDTEEEFDWAAPFNRKSTAVTAMERLPEAQNYFREAGATPVYVVDYPIVADDRSAGILCEIRARDGCEVGTHLHPWVNPPYDEETTQENSYTSNLPRELQAAKLKALTEKIAERLGERPIVYRAGRYGIGEHSAALLEAEGYRMDVSVRTLFDYGEDGGPDFSRFETDAFWAGEKRELLELPLTATYIGYLRKFGAQLFPLGDKIPLWRGALARTKMLQRVALTPEDYPLDVALEAIERLLYDGLNIFSLSFHSPTIAPGHTSYVRDEADLRTFYAWWDGVFELFAKHGVTSARADEVIAAADAAR